MYREANGWQSTFYVPHDIPGLIRLFGSKRRFASKLDSLFSLPWNPRYIARNISCFIGQYCQGNQPDHNFPFLYYFIGEQQKTQKILDTIMTNLYGIGKKELALPGMDDAGEMSCWYVFNAMGFYPFSPAETYYFVSVPVFDEVRLDLPGDPPFYIKKSGSGSTIESVVLNGQKLKNLRISHAQIVRGGHLSMRVQ
jgi:putative alpha-1,2-mannosidase